MSAAAAAAAQEPTVTDVQLEGLVLLKIVKHCEASYPLTVAGQLLGMDVDTTLEITNSYAFPHLDAAALSSSSAPSAAAAAATAPSARAIEEMQSKYQMEMMRCNREVGVDHQVVGWYQSCGSNAGAFMTREWVETQYSYQVALGGNAVCIVYDPVKAQEGTVSMRAYRLTRQFVRMYAKGGFGSLAFAKFGVGVDNMLEEVPIRLHNSTLIDAHLVDMEFNDSLTGVNDPDIARLDLSARQPPALETALGYLMADLEELSKEQAKYAFYLRNTVRASGAQMEAIRKKVAAESRARRAGDAIPDEEQWALVLAGEPPRLDAKLLMKEIDGFARNIKACANENMLKQSAVNAVQADIEE